MVDKLSVQRTYLVQNHFMQTEIMKVEFGSVTIDQVQRQFSASPFSVPSSVVHREDLEGARINRLQRVDLPIGSTVPLLWRSRVRQPEWGVVLDDDADYHLNVTIFVITRTIG